MSLTFSPAVLSPADVTRLLGNAGIPVRYEDSFPASPSIPEGSGTPNGRVLAFPVPADNSALTLATLKRVFGSDPKRQPVIFDHDWYAGEPFMSEPCAPGWRVLGMEVGAESISCPWSDAGGRLPSAMEVTLMLFLHYLATGEQLLSRKHTWCRDEASLGRRVTVGAFGRNGLFLSAHPPVYSSHGLGSIWRYL